MKVPSLLELELGAVVGLVVVGALAVYFVVRNPFAIARGAVNTAGDLAGGAVVGLGEQLGIPATDMDECERAIAEGRTWDASFACPAGRFLRHIFSSSGSPPERLPSPYSINPRDRT